MAKVNPKNKIRKYPLSLSLVEIAIIKGGLKYWALDNEFGYGLYEAQPFSCVGSSGTEPAIKIFEQLETISLVKPDFGPGGDFDRLVKIYTKEVKKARREGTEAEKRSYEHYLIDQMEKLIEASAKTGNYEWEKMIKDLEKQREIENAGGTK